MSASVRIIGIESTIASFARMAPLLAVTSRQAVTVSALKIKNDAARRSQSSGHAKHYSRSITYDVHGGAASVWAEIGPDKARTQGALGNIIEFGTRNNAPRPHLGPALYAEDGGFYRGMQIAVRQATA
ncbi:hypothetical protein ACPCTH_33520 [Streptomyces cellulosae]